MTIKDEAYRDFVVDQANLFATMVEAQVFILRELGISMINAGDPKGMGASGLSGKMKAELEFFRRSVDRYQKVL